MIRVLHAYVPRVDRSTNHLPVIFQILHKGIKFVRRDPRRHVHVPAGLLGSRSRPLFVIPVGIVIGCVLGLYESAVSGDLTVNTFGRLFVLKTLQRNISGINNLAVGRLSVRGVSALRASGFAFAGQRRACPFGTCRLRGLFRPVIFLVRLFYFVPGSGLRLRGRVSFLRRGI